MQGMLEQALANPWAALEHVLDGPLHPGGRERTDTLLDRTGVVEGTRVLDAGCGPGYSVDLARERGAKTIGVDLDPPRDGIRGDLSMLPVQDCSVDVVLAECVLCLLPDRTVTFDEFHRILRPDGRLAVSDVVVDGTVPDVPEPIAESLCLSNTTSQEQLIAEAERAGFLVENVCDHRDDLLAMRDQIDARVDYESLLGLLGERGEQLLSSIKSLESAVETGQIGYISAVGTHDTTE